MKDKCIYYIDQKPFLDDSCRFLETDLRDMLNKDMNFAQHLDNNEQKYRFVYGILFKNSKDKDGRSINNF